MMNYYPEDYYPEDINYHDEIKCYPDICKTLCSAYQRKLHKIPSAIINDALWYSSLQYQQVKDSLKDVLSMCMSNNFIYNIIHLVDYCKPFIDNFKSNTDIRLYQEQFTCSNISRKQIKDNMFIKYKKDELVELILSFIGQIEFWLLTRRNNISFLNESATVIYSTIEHANKLELYYNCVSCKIHNDLSKLVMSYFF